MTREYSATPSGHIPPAQWGEFYGRAGDDGFELFGAVPNDDGSEDLCLQPAVHQPDELQDAHSPVAPLAARCVNGTLLRPGNAEEEPPSTACQQSEARAPGAVPLGRGTPGQQQSPGGVRGRNINPPPPPPPPTRRPSESRKWQRQSMESSRWTSVRRRHWVRREALGQEEQDHLHQEEDQEEEVCRQGELHPSSQEEDQAIQALLHRHLQALHSLYAHQIHGAHSIDPGRPYRS